MSSNVLTSIARTASFWAPARRIASYVTLGLALLAPIPAVSAEPVVLHKAAATGELELYIPRTRAVLPLTGTQNMGNAILGDIDANGADHEIIYRNTLTGGLGYYRIPSNGVWTAANNYSIPRAHSDAVPLTVMEAIVKRKRVKVVVYRSASTGQAYAIQRNGSGRTSLGAMDRAYGADLRGLGYKGDLVWWRNGLGMRWRQGLNGTNRSAPYADWVPLGVGQTIPNHPDKTMVFFATEDSYPTMYACDSSWSFIKLEGTAWPWSVNPGSTVIGNTDSDTAAEIVFARSSGQNLEWYNVPQNGGPWDTAGLVADVNVQCGWNLGGAGSANVVSPATGAVSVSRIAELAVMPDGAVVQLAAKPRTKLVRELDAANNPVTTGYYIEETDQSAGIRIVGSGAPAEGQFVTVRGTLSTLNGERVIMASDRTLAAETFTVAPLATTIKALFGTVALTGLLAQMPGTITSTGVGWFTFSDGTTPIRVYCADPAPGLGQADLTGCVGVELDSSGRSVPVVRLESASDIDPIIIPLPPAISVEPSTLSFGSVDVGSSKNLTFVVKNTGEGTLSGTVSVPAGAFSVVSGASYGLGAGEQAAVTIRFAPTSALSYSASVTFTGASGMVRTVSGAGIAATASPLYSVWTRPSIVKVLKSDPAQPLQPGSIKAAKNEAEAFQIVVRTGGTQVNSVTVTAHDLVSANGRIGATSVSVLMPTYIYLPSQAKDYPDPLPPYRGPFTMAANQTTALWIEVDVPETAAAGDYTSTITIADASGAVTQVPYSLHVYNFALPDTPKCETSFGLWPGQLAPKEGVSVGSYAYQQLHKKYYEFLLQHGISTFYEQPVYPYPDGLFQAEGASYIQDSRASTFYAQYYTNTSLVKQILDRYRSLGIWDKHYFYPTDEPATRAQYDELHAKANLMRSIYGDVQIMVPYWKNPDFGGRATSELVGYCDIWCPITDLWDRDPLLAGDLNQARARGEKVWNYVATGPGYPYCNFTINYAALELRMWLWQTYLYNTTGILYWCSNYWDGVTDPWTNPNTLNDTGAYGGGTILYPGRKVGIDGPVGSVRLKLIRDGLEDYDYLWLLEQKIGRTAVLPYVQRLTTSWRNYTRDTTVFEAVRDDIARQIEN